MKTFTPGSLIAFAALLVSHASASAALVFSPGYSGAIHHTHINSDSLYSFDWGDDGNLYYATATDSFTFGGLYRSDGTSTDTITAANSNYAGGSVVAIGSSIYYNDSTAAQYNLYRYDLGDASTASIQATNYALGTDGTSLYTTGSSDFSTTDILYYANGVLGPSIHLGNILGNSGPLAFDGQGNLFYAPGFGDLSIYRWSSAEVAGAISSNGTLALQAAGHLWIDYSTSFASAGGVSSMLPDAEGNLIVTLTDFSNPSWLVKFDAGGGYDTILTSDERLGELRMHEGNLYLSSANEIVRIVPEPSSAVLSLLAAAALGWRRRRIVSTTPA